jgi:large subunit ribosomal protein L12e
VKFKVVGGEVPNAAQIAPKLSPLGVNPKKIGDDIQKMTKDWKGIKIMIELSVQNREAKVIPLPTIAARVIKAMAEPTRDRKKQKIRKNAFNL